MSRVRLAEDLGRIACALAWSWICAVTISSSAPVARDELVEAAPHRRRRADDRAGQRVVQHRRARAGRAGVSMSSTGGGSGPGRPRRRLTKACCSEVNRRRASASVSAANDVDAEHHIGLAEPRRRAEAARGRSRSPASAAPARSARRRRRAGRASPRAARRRGWSRGSRPAPSAPRRARRARAGRGSPAEIAHQLDDVPREVVGVAGEVAAQRARGRPGRCPARGRGRGRCGPGSSAASVPNCSAITSGAWFGSMMPPAPTRIVEVPPATWRDDAPRSRRWRCRACCGARPASSGGSPGLRRGARGRRSCASAWAASLPSGMGERSRTESAVMRGILACLARRPTAFRSPPPFHAFRPALA